VTNTGTDANAPVTETVTREAQSEIKAIFFHALFTNPFIFHHAPVFKYPVFSGMTGKKNSPAFNSLSAGEGEKQNQ
jgi:hypothetical protein